MNVIDPSKAEFSWTDPTTNVDGSPIVPGEVTGYVIGVRPASGVAGNYPAQTTASGAATVQQAASAFAAMLVPGDYFGAVRTDGPVPSDWSAEVAFSVAPVVVPPLPQPNPPTDFSVA